MRAKKKMRASLDEKIKKVIGDFKVEEMNFEADLGCTVFKLEGKAGVKYMLYFRATDGGYELYRDKDGSFVKSGCFVKAGFDEPWKE